jgi:hypothetical protein
VEKKPGFFAVGGHEVLRRNSQLEPKAAKNHRWFQAEVCAAAPKTSGTIRLSSFEGYVDSQEGGPGP